MQVRMKHISGIDESDCSNNIFAIEAGVIIVIINFHPRYRIYKKPMNVNVRISNIRASKRVSIGGPKYIKLFISNHITQIMVFASGVKHLKICCSSEFSLTFQRYTN